jgi:PAS domain S-box-containing protein
METMFRNSDGSLVPCSVSAMIVRGANGESKTVATLRDISGRKQAERERVEAETRFRSLVEQWFTGIFVIQDQKLAYCNPRFIQILGYAAEGELVGRDLLSVVAGKGLAAAAGILRRLIEDEPGPVSHAFTAVRKDGSSIEVELQGTRAAYRGRPAIIGMIQEISPGKSAPGSRLKEIFLKSIVPSRKAKR